MIRWSIATRALLCTPLLALSLAASAQPLPAYVLFDGQGRAISHKRLLRIVAGADIVLFGELHNNAIAHWLQLVVARELATVGPLTLGAEMIEADDQPALDRYLRGEIDQAALDTLARLWPNHKGDYAPLVDLAREKGIPFIATNVPRRYAAAVNKGGFAALDTLSAAQRAWMAPLPIAFDPALPGYVKMLTMMGDHGTPTMVQAQSLKDATMAHFIARYAKQGARFLHFNGSFHSDFHEGIGWYLERMSPGLKRVTITTVTQEQLKTLDKEHRGRADVIICVDAAVPGTY